MKKKLINEYNNLISELMEASCNEEWDKILEVTHGSYDKAIVLLKLRLELKLFPYINYTEDEDAEEIFYNNSYNIACSIEEQNKFLWFLRDPIIFSAFIKFSLREKFIKSKRR